MKGKYPSNSRKFKPPSKPPVLVHGVLSSATSVPKNQICPVCCGDGGVRGGCYKCDGTGWVSTTIKSSYRGDVALRSGDNSRISNANYLSLNQGASYRERDGRIGTIPDYDDYYEEGDA